VYAGGEVCVVDYSIDSSIEEVAANVYVFLIVLVWYDVECDMMKLVCLFSLVDMERVNVDSSSHGVEVLSAGVDL
jgi:hypothetical protein